MNSLMKALASPREAKRSGKSGPYFMVLKSNSLYVLTVALFDDVGVVGFDDGLGVETPRRVGPGGAFVVMMAG